MSRRAIIASLFALPFLWVGTWAYAQWIEPNCAGVPVGETCPPWSPIPGVAWLFPAGDTTYQQGNLRVSGGAGPTRYGLDADYASFGTNSVPDVALYAFQAGGNRKAIAARADDATSWAGHFQGKVFAEEVCVGATDATCVNVGPGGAAAGDLWTLEGTGPNIYKGVSTTPATLGGIVAIGTATPGTAGFPLGTRLAIMGDGTRGARLFMDSGPAATTKNPEIDLELSTAPDDHWGIYAAATSAAPNRDLRFWKGTDVLAISEDGVMFFRGWSALSVTLAASPNSGTAPLNDVSLTATVGGSATGNIRYQIDCTNNASYEVDVTNSTNPYTNSTCDYTTVGTHTARVVATRGGSTAESTATITTSALTVTVSLAANPTSGMAPLNSTFTATVGGTATGAITYEYDCDTTGGVAYGAGTASNTQACTYTSGGTFTAAVRATRQGVSATASTTVTVTAPTISVTLAAVPASGAAPVNSTLTADVSGTATGVIQYQFDCMNDGVYEYAYTNSNDPYTLTIPCNYTSGGTFTAKVQVTRQGVSATATTVITVTGATLSVTLTANPASGTAAPLNSSLTADVSGSATGNIIYQFDCMNDSTYEYSNTNATDPYTYPTACTYSSNGTFTAKVQVTRQGVSATATTTITLTVPTLTITNFTASPTTGTAPFNSTMSVSIGGTATGNSVYEIDCAGDGTYEHVSAATSSTTYNSYVCVFASSGIYVSKAKVTRQGLTVERSLTSPAEIVVYAPSGILAVSLTANPSSGSRPLNSVDLRATVSGSATGDIQYRFDCTNNGSWDHSPAAMTANPYTWIDGCSFSVTGTFTARVRVTRGSSIATGTATISVSPDTRDS